MQTLVKLNTRPFGSEADEMAFAVMFPIILELALKRLFPRRAKTAIAISIVGGRFPCEAGLLPGGQKEPSPGPPKLVGVMVSGRTVG